MLFGFHGTFQLLHALFLPESKAFLIPPYPPGDLPHIIEGEQMGNIVYGAKQGQVLALRYIFQQTVLVQGLVDGVDEDLPEIGSLALQVGPAGQLIPLLFNILYGIVIVFFFVTIILLKQILFVFLTMFLSLFQDLLLGKKHPGDGCQGARGQLCCMAVALISDPDPILAVKFPLLVADDLA